MVKKDIKLSNLKGILIFLVVFGHFIEIYKHEFYPLYGFIYAFHMPLFVFISGYLAKRMRPHKIVNFILLYFIFQTIYNAIFYETGEFSYSTPRYHLWYIVSLSMWYGVVWIISHLHLNASNKWAIFLIGLFISFISRWYTDEIVAFVQNYAENFSSYTLSWQRTLTFLPFFLLGYFLNEQKLAAIYRSMKSRAAIVISFLLTALATCFYSEFAYGVEQLFKGSFGAHEYLSVKDSFSKYAIKTAFHYGLAVWLCYLMVNFISNKPHRITYWGDNSLTIYLFHPMIVFALEETYFLDDWTLYAKCIALFLTALSTTMLLSSRYFVKAAKHLCHPYQLIKHFKKIARPKTKYFPGNMIFFS